MSREAQIEVCLRELLRLYDWRFEIARLEDAGKNVQGLLHRYGEEKKAAWQLARVLVGQ